MPLRLSRNRSKTARSGHRIAGRLGVAGFLFFLVKGLVWLLLGALATAGIL